MSLSSLALRWSARRAPLIARATTLCARYNSTYTPQTAALADIDPSRLKVTKRTDLKPQPDLEGLAFGRVFTDHMLTIPWTAESGWDAPQITPYGPLHLEPSSTVLHYAQTLFEGMKAYKNAEGKVTLFRPDMNMKRMITSASRIALPTFNGDALLDLIKQLIRLDAHWIPERPGYSLYIRPTLIGTQRAIGVGPPDEALLFVILSPVGPYYKTGFKPVALHATTEYSRAAPGGTGAFKLGANYAPGVVPQREAAVHGYSQNLWLHGPEHYLTEVGTMNMFVAIRNAQGVAELITPPLDGMILPGVTRDSVLSIAREHASGAHKISGLPDQLIVSERPVTMPEVKQALKDGALLELFGAGTAAIISPVDRVGYLGDDLIIPTGPDGLGPLSKPILAEIQGRQRGEIPSSWSVAV
ncbi:branched-chain amino acid aminotransferase II [Exidia glandulosa HHB12029]|uniref:Branched-chain-amino-acid aminotransferase n=1 Tax=Exidia glandulosa HHB12029 TaxID=1314781 RepID=A0A166BL21_EXIGL|nr:branched-chain amino acid aminotransferase II [Exidia glandulosa HHB12029]